MVGIVALPLSMALAIAVGAPPQAGLYTAIVAGFIVALLGGSRTQVTGPTAAFVVILAPIYARFGLPGLLVSGLLAGIILVAMGLLRLGRFIEFIPYPVTTGFTAGIGTVIAVLQLKDFFGLKLEGNPEQFLDRAWAMAQAVGTVSVPEMTIGLTTLACLLVWPRLVRKVPAALIALPLAAAAALLLPKVWPGFDVATIASTFETKVRRVVVHGIPQMPPMPLLPWLAEGHRHAFPLDFNAFRQILPGAFTIAMLGAIESLLSAVVADGLARTKHDPDAELVALGVGNIVTPFFGGIPATGAIARTATNVRAGARSPFAAMIHALVVLAAMLALAPLIGYLPMASLAALLLVVAWNMSEVKHVRRIIRIAPTSDVLVLLTCYALTVFFDMVTAVSVGVGLAALLFMRRMVEVADTRLSEVEHPDLPRHAAQGRVRVRHPRPALLRGGREGHGGAQRGRRPREGPDPEDGARARDRRHRAGGARKRARIAGAPAHARHRHGPARSAPRSPHERGHRRVRRAACSCATISRRPSRRPSSTSPRRTAERRRIPAAHQPLK